MTPLSSQRERLAAIAPVSGEVWERLQAYARHLEHWQKTLNLVAPSTLPALWERHILDSWQLVPLVQAGADGGGAVLDFGSGAGLPGLVLAMAGVPDVHLVESNHRKAAFLRFAAEQTGAACQVHAARIESLSPAAFGNICAITARALASLPELLAASAPFCNPGTRLYFPKGRRWREEVAAAENAHAFTLTVHESVTDREAVILELQHLSER